jgi:uncharacterized membrane protein
MRIFPVLALAGLALSFGRSLRPGRVTVIERIARVSDPELSPRLREYTRRLTAVWCAYFVAAALLVATAVLQRSSGAGLVWLGTGLLFVGEHRLRRRLFPGHRFPGLRQQLSDTLSVWRRGA